MDQRKLSLALLVLAIVPLAAIEVHVQYIRSCGMGEGHLTPYLTLVMPRYWTNSISSDIFLPSEHISCDYS